jgi:hypothetical protein
MNRKLPGSMGFLLLILVVSVYFLWQIDRHEKALFCQEWINPVPYLTWQKYLHDKEDYQRLIQLYEANNPDIIRPVRLHVP